MADFLTAYKTVRANEGGYRNVPYDKGGETYKGIARNFHGSWVGWKIIDEYKRTNGPIKQGAIIANATLDKMVTDFFQKLFWTSNNLYAVANQSIATLCLDMVINHGRGPVLINDEAKKIKSSIAQSTNVTLDTVKVINDHPDRMYKAIAERRVKYVESLGEQQLGPDYPGVLARAKKFLSLYRPEAAAVGVGLLLLTGLFFLAKKYFR